MEDKLTFDELWDGVKSHDEHSKDTLECSEEISNIIQSIVQARIDKGWSQRDLAKACKLNQPAIARMETMQVVPRLDTIVKIAHRVDLKICTQSIPQNVDINEANIITFQTKKTRYIWTHPLKVACTAIGG